MAADLPEFYFRVRENGATVFRVETENRQRRIEMEELAVVNIKNGQIRPHGDRELSAGEIEVINDWMEERRQVVSTRDLDELYKVVDHLNRTAHWAQSKAEPEQLEALTDDLLLAMHDLRTVLVRKQADRLAKRARKQA